PAPAQGVQARAASRRAPRRNIRGTGKERVMTKKSGPLAGIRVLDASMGAVGPWAGALLGGLGADVVKLESPQGDFIRNITPRKKGLSTTYISMNFNKRFTVFDLKSPEELETVRKLA